MGTVRTRDPEATRASILEAAEKLFADRGFSATSIRDVAESSGSSKALIHHHFGNKEDLYLAVKRAVIERYRHSQSSQLEPGTDPAKFLVEGMRTLFDFYRENPTLVRLATWGQLEGDTERWPGDDELWHVILERMQLAQQSGVLRADLHPAFLLTMADALAYHWWQFKAYRAHLSHYFPEPDELDDLYVNQMIELFLRGAAGPALNRNQTHGEGRTEGRGDDDG